MPLPTPTGTESESEFMMRCMDNATMMDDFPERDQRVAVCQAQWNGGKASSDSIEYKSFDFEFEFKAENSRNFSGYAAVFNNVDLGGDVIVPGAFTKNLSRKMPKMLSQHNPDWVVGVWDRMSEDQKGLHAEGHFIDTTLGRDAYVEAKAGARDGLSIGFKTLDAEGRSPRRLKELKVIEVSLVTFPMNVEAVIESIKSDSAGCRTVRELEAAFEKHLSRSKARAYIAQLSQIFKQIHSDGTSRDSLRDAGHESDHMVALRESIDALSDKLRASILR